MENEIWKDIKGYERRYKISNFGNVKSLIYRNQKGIERILNWRCTGGYAYVQLTNRINFLVHRLVVEAFIGEIGELTVNHKDFNRLNNHVSNLEIISRGENSLHGMAHKRDLGQYSSKIRGVSFFENTGKWRAQKMVNGKIKHVGYYDTEILANNALLAYTP